MNEFTDCFDGYPYLVTLLGANEGHIHLLPETWSQELMLEFGFQQQMINNFPIAIVFANDLCVHGRAGQPIESNEPPLLSTITTEKLAPIVEIPCTSDVQERRARLKAHIETTEEWHDTVQTKLKGGRLASPEEWRMLRMIKSYDGQPGLKRCWRCKEFFGTCLDPDQNEVLVNVLCRCLNLTGCASCYGRLASRSVSACYYDERTQHIVYVPGRAALAHKSVCSNAFKPAKTLRSLLQEVIE